MSWELKVILVVVCILTCVYTLRKIKKSQMQIEDSLFWIIVSLGLMILSIFPGLADGISDLLGSGSTVNCGFLIMIFILILKTFLLTLKVSQ